MRCIPPSFRSCGAVGRLLTIGLFLWGSPRRQISAISHPAFAPYTPPQCYLFIYNGCIPAETQRGGCTSLEAKLNGLRINFASMKKPEQSAEKECQMPPNQRVPFIIQKIGRGDKENIEEITRLCIDVFFNEQDGVTDPKRKTVACVKLTFLQYFSTTVTCFLELIAIPLLFPSI